MRIYIPHVLEEQPWAMPAQDGDNLRLFGIEGPVQAGWSPIEMEIFDPKTEQPVTPAPMTLPWYNQHLLLFPEDLRHIVDEVLAPYGEWLSVHVDPPHSIFNVTTRIDALNLEQSRIWTSDDDGSVMEVERYAFHAQSIGSVQAFRLLIPGHPFRVSPVFLQQPIIEELRAAGVRGVGFRLVWDEDDENFDEKVIEL